MFIILSVCLLASPNACKQEELHTIAAGGPPMACLVEGQGDVARWADTHPQWRVVSWKCVPARPGAPN